MNHDCRVEGIPFLKRALRRYRRRGALTQEEIAFLLGAACGTNVCRHERADRPPSLHTALAYQAIFGVPIHELFPRDYREVLAEVQARAALLSRHVARRPDARKTPFKQRLLASAGAVAPTSPPHQHDRQTS
jgi:DNA-binding XRE family transcriptional regulator